MQKVLIKWCKRLHNCSQQTHDFQTALQIEVTSLRIEVTGRLIGKDELRAKDKGTDNLS